MQILKSFIGVCCLFMMASSSYSQADTMGSVKLVKDYRIDLLVKKQSQINKLSVYKNSKGEYKGYRLMVLNTNNRTLAYKTRADILRYFPDNNVYMAYQSPYFKIKMGDFLKKEDAEKIKADVSKLLNQNVFIMQDIINLKPEEEAKLLEEESNKEVDADSE